MAKRKKAIHGLVPGSSKFQSVLARASLARAGVTFADVNRTPKILSSGSGVEPHVAPSSNDSLIASDLSVELSLGTGLGSKSSISPVVKASPSLTIEYDAKYN